MQRRFNANSKVLIGKHSFQNLKESLDNFLFECNKAGDFESALAIKRYFEVFNLKNGTAFTGKENEGSGSLTQKETS